MLVELRQTYRKIMPYVVIGYIAVFAISFFLLNFRLSVEWVAIALMGAATLTGRIKSFFRDWGVFIAAVIAWQVTDGLALRFNFPWHVNDMIDADRWMFRPVLNGQIPTIWLQKQLFHNGLLSWYDVMSVVLYSLHFLLPLGAGFILWLVNRDLFHKYAIAFIVAAIAGFATYIVYPAVPPWMAAQYASHCVGNFACYKLPGDPMPVIGWVWNVWSHTMAQWMTTSQGNVGFAQFTMGYDQVGAVPSEHVMFPTLVFLFFRRQFGKLGYLMVPYTLLVLFSVVYMGQHYVIDGIVGALYAVVVYIAVMKLFPRVSAYFAAHPVPNPFPSLGPRLAPARPGLSEDMVAVDTSDPAV